MKINMLKGERFEINPEEINVTFDDVKGVSWFLMYILLFILYKDVHLCERIGMCKQS
jgi:hypothetical protein